MAAEAVAPQHFLHAYEREGRIGGDRIQKMISSL